MFNFCFSVCVMLSGKQFPLLLISLIYLYTFAMQSLEKQSCLRLSMQSDVSVST